MKRRLRFCAAAVAVWLLCGGLPLYFSTRAQDSDRTRTGSWATNVNGNMNAGSDPNADRKSVPPLTGVPMNGNLGPSFNMNVSSGSAPAEAHETGDEPPLVLGEWSEVEPSWGNVTVSPLVLRDGTSAGARVMARVSVEEGEGVSILEAVGDRLRVRVEANAEQGGTRQRPIEGWAEWGAVLPAAEALVVDVASGEIRRRVPLEGGVESILFAPGGGTAFFYGVGAAAVYEASTEDFKPRRALRIDGAFSIGDLFFQPQTAQLLLPLWRMGDAADADGEVSSDYALGFLRVGGGAAARVPTALRSASGGRFLVSDDGQTGVALYPAGAAWGAADRVAAAVFDLQTLTQIREFVLPAAVTTDDDIALVRGGAELLALPAAHPQSLFVIESLAGALVREVPLGRRSGGVARFARTGPGGGPLLLSYAEHQDDGYAALRRAQLTAEGRLTRLSQEVALVAEAGSARYGVDDEGTRLFVLNGEGRIRATRRIKGAAAKPVPATTRNDERPVLGFAVTPDGKQFIIIKGAEACC
jgi:hypothetical protein